MAHGTDSEEFRFVSGARSGLKREFAFALKNQSDFAGSTGRTRGNKTPPPPCQEEGEDDDLSVKRLKKMNDVKGDDLDPVQTDSNPCMDESVPDLGKSVEEQVKSEIPVVIDENAEEQKPEKEAPFSRRFTRSLLKPKEEPQTSSGSVVLSEEACTKDDVISPLKRSSNNNRLEMKMSKKIALHRVPSNIRDLLNTGFLDGLSVKYLFLNKRDGKLSGTITKGGILCNCASCQGNKVVSAYEFERHAGSAQKHASNNIYLENGYNLRDVLDACKGAPTELYEESINNAISSCPETQNRVCLSCQEPLLASCKSFCESCLLSKDSLASPARELVSNSRSSKSGLIPKESSTAPKPPSQAKIKGKITRKDQRLHKLVFEEDGLPDGTELAYYIRGQKIIEGYKKGLGIFCFHCHSEVSPSQFEAHAGYASRRKPYLNIYTSNGVSLHELSISLSKSRELSSTDNDDLCGFCSEPGDLLCCDMCPRAFHQDCVDIPEIPSGKWYCRYCLNMIEREKCCEYNANAKAAGRVSGVDPIEQITKRCIRIIDTAETEVGGCVLCRRRTFSKAEFGPSTVILCDQCEKEYHVGCLKDHKIADLKEEPEGKWFCCTECSRIHLAMQKLVTRGSEKLPDSLLKVIKQKQEAKNSGDDPEFDVRWKVLSGKTVTPEDKSLLSKAIAIFHDQFAPIVDSKSGIDYIPAMVYGRNVRDQEFGGMYCAVLTVNSRVVSAGIMRVFGQDIAEIPLVATSSDYQGKGYFQSLLTCIERLLGFLNVKNIVLPSALESKAIWTDKFGFTLIPPAQLGEYKNNCPLMIFQGTSLLQKEVPKCRIVRKPPGGS